MGARLGFRRTRMNTKMTYVVAIIRPGKNPATSSLPTGICASVAVSTARPLGGMMAASRPELNIVPKARRGE